MTSKDASPKISIDTLIPSGTYDWVDHGGGNYSIIRKKMGPGWTKVAGIRNESTAAQMAMLLNLGQEVKKGG